jgi:transposase
MVPRQDESAGKHRSTRLRHGAPWLKPVLTQCGWAASRSRRTYLQAQYFRLKARRGPKKAVIAVAASILTAVYHMLKSHVACHALGPDHFVKHDTARIAAKLAQRIKDLGYEVQYSAAA